MLLFSAGLFFQGAIKAGGLNPGFDPRGGIITEMDFTLGKNDENTAKREMFAAAQRARNSGVRNVTLSTMLPYGNITNTRRIMPANAAPAAQADPNSPNRRQWTIHRCHPGVF